MRAVQGPLGPGSLSSSASLSLSASGSMEIAASGAPEAPCAPELWRRSGPARAPRPLPRRLPPVPPAAPERVESAFDVAHRALVQGRRLCRLQRWRPAVTLLGKSWQILAQGAPPADLQQRSLTHMLLFARAFGLVLNDRGSAENSAAAEPLWRCTYALYDGAMQTRAAALMPTWDLPLRQMFAQHFAAAALEMSRSMAAALSHGPAMGHGGTLAVDGGTLHGLFEQARETYHRASGPLPAVPLPAGPPPPPPRASAATAQEGAPPQA